MNGRRLLLDTNAIVYLLAGNKEIGDILKSAEWVGISVISQIEFLAFSDLDKRDEQLFIEFLKRVEVIGLPAIDDRFINRIVYLRQKYAIKIPDAIIGATSLEENAVLLTADQDFKKIKELKVTFPPIE